MITLYEHNQQVYEAALSFTKETGKAAVIHPTGTGKSFVALRLAKPPGVVLKQIAPLDSNHMRWENLIDVCWERNFEHASAYFETYGDLNVPYNYTLKKIGMNRAEDRARPRCKPMCVIMPIRTDRHMASVTQT